MTEPSIRVLLVEDNPGDALLVSEALSDVRDAVFEIRTAGRVVDAVRALGDESADIVLLDLSLPDSTGIATLQTLRASWPGIPIVVLTGLDDDDVGIASVQAGAQDYIVKDEATPRRLGRAVRFALERTQATQQVQQWRERYTLWIEQSTDGLWDWDLGTGKVTYSPGWKESLGFGPTDISDGPQEWFDRVVARDAPRLANAIQTAIDSEDATFDVRYRMRNKERTVVWMRARAMIVRDSSGRATRLAGSQADITADVQNPCVECGNSNLTTASDCELCGAPLRLPGDRSAPPRLGGGDIPAGTMIGGNYRIEELINVGGAGAVYVAVDERVGRRVAVKIMHSWLFETADSRTRFVEEGQIQTRVQHANVVRVFDVVVTEEFAYSVMEYVAGPTLREFMLSRDAPADTGVLVAWFLPVVEGIGVAHDAGVVHRDIKPENILVAPTVDGFAFKVTDFGVAKIPGANRLTKTGAMLGTLKYMAPEQFVDARSADRPADVYALGCTLYELLTRRPPFEHASEFHMMTAHLTETPTHPRTFNPLISPGLGDVILHALEKDPADRYQDCGAFLSALSDAVE